VAMADRQLPAAMNSDRAAANSSSDAGNSTVVVFDVGPSTPPRPADSVAGDDADDFADETNSWPARTAARFLCDQVRRNSARSMFKHNRYDG